ncbi:MAG: response regulator [Bacteroides sp.]|nr:response regulator [Bacteroides sp.]
MMPSKDGYELCEELKNNMPTSHIPVILLTACSMDEQKVTGFESGADAYIAKPFNATLLNTRIRKLIEGREKLKETFGNSLPTGSPNQNWQTKSRILLTDLKSTLKSIYPTRTYVWTTLPDH